MTVEAGMCVCVCERERERERTAMITLLGSIKVLAYKEISYLRFPPP